MSIKQDSIKELAYHLWLQRGRPHGTSEQDWLEAESQLRNGSASASTQTSSTQSSLDQALSDSFPASDPPASHLVDLPPANANSRGRRQSNN